MSPIIPRFPRHDKTVIRMKKGLVKSGSASGVFIPEVVVVLLVNNETCSDSSWRGDIQLTSVDETVSKSESVKT